VAIFMVTTSAKLQASKPVTGETGLFASPEKRSAVLCLLLALLTLALYNPVSRHPFVNYDDDRYVTENSHVRDGLTWNTFTWALTSTEQANWHPLTRMSHALDCSLFGMNPAGHHLTSALLHTVNVVLLFLLLMVSTRRAGPSFFVAALFAVHPFNVESVAWVAERKNVLCTMFFLLTLGAYGWYARHPDWKRYLSVMILFAAGLASKPMVITLPFVLLLLDYWPLMRVRGSASDSQTAVPTFPWSRLLLEKLPLLALSAFSAIITMRAQAAGGAVRSIQQFSFGVRVETAIYAYAMYLWKMVWPVRLAPLYPHPGDSLDGWQIALAGLTLAGITVLAFRFRARRYLLAGWLWFLGTLFPVIGLVQVGDAAMADRYAYIPLIGIFAGIAFGMADIVKMMKASMKTAAYVGAALLLAALAMVTHRQIGYWQSSYDLWSHAVQVTQNNFIAEDNLGGALLLMGREEEAYPHFEAAAKINPRDPLSRGNLGTYAQSHGHMQEAVMEYQAAIALTSDPGLLAQSYANLGAAQRAMGDDAQARNSFAESLRINPKQFNAWLGLGLLAQKEGKLDEAIVDLARSVESHPTAEGYLQLGRALAQANRDAEALSAYEQALKISPDMTEAQQAAAVLREQH
jgi:protein O-mannosyl-transferase